MNNNNEAAPIPVGFRFHPTDEELVGYYLHGKVGRAQRDQLIQELDLYKIEPWDLHELCRIGDDATENQSDWYFFSHKDKKYPTGNRANRATAAGFWKATGRDKPIYTQRHVIGMRKTLVFYRGRAPHGQKTDWIMHEFRLDVSDHSIAAPAAAHGFTVPNNESDGWVVCRVFRKTKNFKTKSQEGTSCSFEDSDQPQVGPNGQLLADSTNFVGHATANGSAISGNVGEYSNNPHIPHHHFNFMTCKQENISVDDYGTPIHHLDQPPCSSTFTVMDSHLAAGTVTGPHPPSLGPSAPSTGSALIRSCLQQACRTKVLDHGREFYSVGPAFHGDSSTSFKDNFDDARSSSTTTAAVINTQEGSGNFPSNEDYWMPEGASSRDNILRLHSTGTGVSRRDQTLADVTCHIHIKRQTPTSDSLFVSHENNLVHLWNV